MMTPPSEKQAAPEIEDLLAELLGVARDKVHGRLADQHEDLDFIVRAKDFTFLVEYRRSASAGLIAGAAEQLKAYAQSSDECQIPLIVVPYMGKAGREICEKVRLSWLDLSGNTKITGRQIRIWIEGRPNKYSRRGRPPNLFAPKSSRIVRQLLICWKQFQSQADLVRTTGLDDGYVSKLVRRLVEERLAYENDKGAVRPKDPSLLLDAWASEYDFGRHSVVKGHVSARSGEELVQRLAGEMERHDVDYATTGLGAAWLLTHFASYRIGTFYLRSRPSQSFLGDIQFWDEEKGANTWLVVPNDEGVFHGSKKIEGITCVSEVQVYLDLKDHPERSKEAAEELRKTCLRWESDD